MRIAGPEGISRDIWCAKHFFTRAVVFLPQTVVFPNRCIFTNAEVNALTRIKLYAHDLQHVRQQKIETFEFSLPLSSAFMMRREQARARVRKLLLRTTIIAFILGVVVALLVPLLTVRHELVMLAGIPWAIGIVSLIVFIAWPYIGDRYADAYAFQGFFDVKKWPNCEVRILEASKEFMDALPQK